MRNNIGAAWMTSMQQCIAHTPAAYKMHHNNAAGYCANSAGLEACKMHHHNEVVHCIHTHAGACKLHHINAVVHCTHMRNNIGAAWMTSMQQCIAHTPAAYKMHHNNA